MAIHYINPSSDTLHGFFSKDIEPAVRINSGDRVIMKTLDAAWGEEERTVPSGTRKKFTDIQDQRKPEGFGHSITGPVYINNAQPGDTLEIKINEIVPGDWGWVSAGGFPSYWNKKLGLDASKEVTFDFSLDHKEMLGKSQFGNFDYAVKLNPFMGIMGMPPAEEGKHTTVVPRNCGGNLDCKELQAGSALFLPIPVEGGLFSAGDGHAAQGDGEVAGPALECPMEKVDLTLTVLKNKTIHTPRAKVKNGWITMGFHENLDEAMWIALNAMLDLMAESYNISRTEACAYASLVVDLRITQIVNFSKGVHAFLPDDALLKV
ncbi:acetamidase/formamidase family protein [Peribacillus deserti]|uniref:Acetamidase n=1 Tax=Peribacillus deserti TaxID=673318 RepID=A0A2N5M6F1_9BACI|nr:acetamidase/formamidase family protein [Peribacillus deserti]PLT29948.1 acetamidase [Peribacillus deserti]